MQAQTSGPTSILPPAAEPLATLLRQLEAEAGKHDSKDSVQLLADALRSGRARFTPGPSAGWNDRTNHALIALLRVSQLPEGSKVSFDSTHASEMLTLFRASYAMLQAGRYSARAERSFMVLQKKTIYLRPRLTIEPLTSYYLRRSKGYAYLRQVLVRLVGAAALAGVRRLTPQGFSKLGLLAEIRWMEAMFHGAYLESCREIGLSCPAVGSWAKSRNRRADRMLFRKWARRLATDPDLQRDVRIMVPMSYDARSKRVVSSLIWGYRTKSVTLKWMRAPRILSIHDAQGRLVPRNRVRIVLLGRKNVGYVNYVDPSSVATRQLLSSLEFRRLCEKVGGDTWKIQEALRKMRPSR